MTQPQAKLTPSIWRGAFLKRLSELSFSLPQSLRCTFMLICDAESHVVNTHKSLQIYEGMHPKAQTWLSLSSAPESQIGFHLRIGGDQSLGQAIIDFVCQQPQAKSWLASRCTP